MKGFFEVLSIVFVGVGAVIGAGFISGGELVSFFGTENFFLPLCFTYVLLSFCLLTLFLLGAKYKTVQSLNQRLLGSGKAFNIAVYISTFISVIGLLAVLDELWYSVGVLPNFPILSLLAVIVLSFISRYGINGVVKVSMFLVPLILVAVNVLIFTNNSILTIEISTHNFGGGKGLLYVAMNCFINLPALVEVASGKSKKSIVLSAVIISIILFVQSLLILCVIKGAGSAIAQSSMPLYNALKQGKYSWIYAVCVLFAVLSSLIATYYHLYLFAIEKGGYTGVILLATFAFLFARLGLKNIVDYVYPVIGAFGLLYLIKCVIFIFKDKKINYGRRNLKTKKSR